jgi:large subunit ribosomal protein L19
MSEVTTITISPVNMDERRRIGIRAGDTVRVWQKIEEKGKTRLQAFEGVVLAQKHGTEPGATFTVRRVAGGYGVEKIFPLYSPNIDKIEITKRAKVRRAKLYHIRDKAAREIKRQMRNMRFVDIATTSDIEEQASAEAEANEVTPNSTEVVKEKPTKDTPPEPAAEAKEETPEGEEKSA